MVVGSGGDGGGQRRLLDAPAAAAAASASAAASAAAAVLMVVAAVTVSAASASWCCHLCFSFVLVGSEVLLLLTRAPIARRDLTAPQAGPASLYHRNLPSSSRNGPFCARIAQLQGLFSPCGAICPCWPAASCLVRRSGWGGPAVPRRLCRRSSRGAISMWIFLMISSPTVGNNLQDGSRRAAAL